MKPKFKQGDRVWLCPFDNGDGVVPEQYARVEGLEDDVLIVRLEPKYKPKDSRDGIMEIPRDQAVLVPSKEAPADLVRKWAVVIGLGFHPDNAGADYDPPLPDPKAYDRDMETAFRYLGDEVYRVALETAQALVTDRN